MPLTSLGFDPWFSEQATRVLQPGQGLARVTAVDRDACLVRTGEAEVHAEISGRLRFQADSPADLPCVGDWVCVQQAAPDDLAIIHHILPRRTFLRRKSPGRSTDVQMIAANIDVAFIVQGCHFDFNIARLDRYLVMALDGGIEPCIVLTKTDLISPEELTARIQAIRVSGITAPVLPVSNATGQGMDEFRTRLEPGRTHCLLGSSGVGKTTLINRLLGAEALETRAVSGTGEGVHTTTRRQLLVLDSGAMLMDTPGMRELGLVGTSGGVEATFTGIGAYADQCRFPDCTHTREPGCAVLKAVEDGELGEDQYRNFLKLRKESEFHDLSHLEKRRKDRAFGKFIKTVKKRMKP